MKVGELIKRLEKCSPDKEVITEGCDCYGDIGFVVPDYAGGVFLANKKGMYYREEVKRHD